MKTITLKRNDNRIALEATLRKPDGTAENLNNAAVKFIMRSGRFNTRYGRYDYNDQAVINREVDTIDAAAGKVWMVFTTQELSAEGWYLAEFEATYPDGRVETYPNTDYIPIQILKDLG